MEQKRREEIAQRRNDLFAVRPEKFKAELMRHFCEQTALFASEALNDIPDLLADNAHLEKKRNAAVAETERFAGWTELFCEEVENLYGRETDETRGARKALDHWRGLEGGLWLKNEYNDLTNCGAHIDRLCQFKDLLEQHNLDLPTLEALLEVNSKHPQRVNMFEKLEVARFADLKSKYHVELADIEAMLEANAEGRVLVLPCQYGTQIWYIQHCTIPCDRCYLRNKNPNRAYHFKCFKEKSACVKPATFAPSWIGYDIYLTRQEAVDALGKEKPDG